MIKKYGHTVERKMKKVMHEFKEGKLKIGRSAKKVKKRAQAIAIGLSEARKRGAKVREKSTKRKSKEKSKKVRTGRKRRT